MAPAPHAPGLMITLLLAPVLLAGCLGDDSPELPNQLRVRDADLPGLTMYLNVTPEVNHTGAPERFHVYAVTVNEGEVTYDICLTARYETVTTHTRTGEIHPRAPYTSIITHTDGTYRAGPGMIGGDNRGCARAVFEPGDHLVFEATWPDPDGVPRAPRDPGDLSDRPGQLPSKPGTYLWEVAFWVRGETGGAEASVSGYVVVDVPASMVTPPAGDETSDNETGSGNASGS